MKCKRLPVLIGALVLAGCGTVQIDPGASDNAAQAQNECMQQQMHDRASGDRHSPAVQRCMERKRAVMEAYPKNDDD